MSTAWQRVHDRHQLSARILADVRRSGRGTVTARWADDIAETFGDLDSFLQHVQRRWYTALAARVDGLLEDDVADRQAAVRALWVDLARTDPASRLLLDAYAGHPALAHGERRHASLLAAVLAPVEPPDTDDATGTARVRRRPCRLLSLLRLTPTR